MKYNAIPATIVTIESGHLRGPGQNGHISVETEAISEIAHLSEEEKEDHSRNVVVITVDNLIKKGKNEPSLEPLALRFDDCRVLCRDLLIHLACGGDDIAKYLCNHLSAPASDDEEEDE